MSNSSLSLSGSSVLRAAFCGAQGPWACALASRAIISQTRNFANELGIRSVGRAHARAECVIRFVMSPMAAYQVCSSSVLRKLINEMASLERKLELDFLVGFIFSLCKALCIIKLYKVLAQFSEIVSYWSLLLFARRISISPLNFSPASTLIGYRLFFVLPYNCCS